MLYQLLNFFSSELSAAGSSTALPSHVQLGLCCWANRTCSAASPPSAFLAAATTVSSSLFSSAAAIAAASTRAGGSGAAVGGSGGKGRKGVQGGRLPAAAPASNAWLISHSIGPAHLGWGQAGRRAGTSKLLGGGCEAGITRDATMSERAINRSAPAAVFCRPASSAAT